MSHEPFYKHDIYKGIHTYTYATWAEEHDDHVHELITAKEYEEAKRNGHKVIETSDEDDA